MRTYSTCQACYTLMHLYAGQRQRAHPTCEETPDALDNLCGHYLAAAEAGETERADNLEAEIHAIQHAPPRLLDAALAYVAWGWPVFPLTFTHDDGCACGDPQCSSGGKHPWPGSRGFKDATTDAATVRAWWTKQPRSNIGLPTGHAFDALDIDPKHGAMDHWPDLRDNGGLTSHGIVSTWSGGLHIYMSPSGAGNGARMFGKGGIDFRGIGGYVVAPPSLVYDKKYTWDVRPSTMLTDWKDRGGADH